MKLLLIPIVLFSVVFFSSESKAQIQIESTALTPTIDSVAYYSPENFLGTFQTMHHTKEREIFTHDLYFEIESRRKDDELVIWKISRFTSFRIFPRNMIMPPMNYRVQDLEIVHIDESADQELEILLNK